MKKINLWEVLILITSASIIALVFFNPFEREAFDGYWLKSNGPIEERLHIASINDIDGYEICKIKNKKIECSYTKRVSENVSCPKGRGESFMNACKYFDDGRISFTTLIKKQEQSFSVTDNQKVNIAGTEYKYEIQNTTLNRELFYLDSSSGFTYTKISGNEYRLAHKHTANDKWFLYYKERVFTPYTILMILSFIVFILVCLLIGVKEELIEPIRKMKGRDR